MYAIPDPAAYPNESEIPESAFRTLMDNSSGTTSVDWYASGVVSFDRGVRNSNVRNDFDAPYWASPAPDGFGRWTWGDSPYNTGCWIEGSQKRGFILVPSLASGRAWYEGSTLHCDGRSFEIQIFDPARLGEVALGQRKPFEVKPASRTILSLPGLGSGRGGNGPNGNVGGASYDPSTRALYLHGFWIEPEIRNRIYVFEVRA
jgi:hypothetical protein